MHMFSLRVYLKFSGVHIRAKWWRHGMDDRCLESPIKKPVKRSSHVFFVLSLANFCTNRRVVVQWKRLNAHVTLLYCDHLIATGDVAWREQPLRPPWAIMQLTDILNVAPVNISFWRKIYLPLTKYIFTFLFVCHEDITVSVNETWYSISQEICTRLCCALLCCGYAIVHNEFTWSIYPYSSGLLCWHWGNR